MIKHQLSLSLWREDTMIATGRTYQLNAINYCTENLYPSGAGKPSDHVVVDLELLASPVPSWGLAMVTLQYNGMRSEPRPVSWVIHPNATGPTGVAVIPMTDWTDGRARTIMYYLTLQPEGVDQ